MGLTGNLVTRTASLVDNQDTIDSEFETSSTTYVTVTGTFTIAPTMAQNATAFAKPTIGRRGFAGNPNTYAYVQCLIGGVVIDSGSINSTSSSDSTGAVLLSGFSSEAPNVMTFEGKCSSYGGNSMRFTTTAFATGSAPHTTITDQQKKAMVTNIYLFQLGGTTVSIMGATSVSQTLVTIPINSLMASFIFSANPSDVLFDWDGYEITVSA